MGIRWMYMRACKTLGLNVTVIKISPLRSPFASATRATTNTDPIVRSGRLFSSSTKDFSDFSGMSAESCRKERLIVYKIPDWLEGKLKFQPKYRVELANIPTRIHKWSLPGVPGRFSVSIKRDDDTGGAISGNKSRKLEFLLADAIDKGCKHVTTCGGIQSNHCRATALGAVQYGLTPHLFLRADIKDPEEVGCDGNLLLNRMCGAKMYFTPRFSPYETVLRPRMEKLAEKIEASTGEKTYHIPVGGSNGVGVYGYLNAFQEMINQGVLEQFDDIVFACGSGGTAEGLALGNYLTGSKVKIHGILVSDSTQYFEDHINGNLDENGLTGVRCRDILDLVEGYKGRGYGLSTPEELDFITDIGVKTGIILDPTYSGKAAYGLAQELQNSPNRFQGTRVLFLHTGGVFGLYDGRLAETLKKEGAATNQITVLSQL
ncbi:uncharacterized protein LOC135479223 [Liolophura sinensis]|uniref:uncharacterized protein LOC135479223 n=1 Tax=Liolophura sinensis TaxID=3198878 RepID=UPI003158F6F2